MSILSCGDNSTTPDALLNFPLCDMPETILFVKPSMSLRASYIASIGLLNMAPRFPPSICSLAEFSIAPSIVENLSAALAMLSMLNLSFWASRVIFVIPCIPLEKLYVFAIFKFLANDADAWLASRPYLFAISYVCAACAVAVSTEPPSSSNAFTVAFVVSGPSSLFIAAMLRLSSSLRSCALPVACARFDWNFITSLAAMP